MIFKLYNAELKPRQVIHVNRVTFCLGQLGQTQLIKSPDFNLDHVLIMPSGPDQSDELYILDNNDGSASPDSP